MGRVVPLHKGGSKHSPNNFRPIPLTSVPCKIFEHVIYSHLANFLDSNAFFSLYQHGFRKTFSCETQLLSFTHNLHSILDRGSQADCVFLDFSKAFDKVSHQLLLFKLSKLNIDLNVLQWIQHFLSHRSQFVSVNGSNSHLTPVNSGVPQGSVLGPLLFLIYINDLHAIISSSVCLFADDCVIYREISTDSDTALLQSDLISISNWCRTWLMEPNITKCKSMRVSRRNAVCPTYYLNSAPLESVHCYKYLGIHIASDLSWNIHIEHVINNANSMLGFLRRNFSSVPSSLKLLLYKSLLRSKLEYAASVWNPGLEYLVQSLEAVQNKSARFTLSNYHRTSSVTSIKLSLSLPTLALRRQYFRLSLFHKIYHNPAMRHNLLTPPYYIDRRLDHKNKVGVFPCNTNAFFYSFIPRTSVEWNHLPHDIATIDNL